MSFIHRTHCPIHNKKLRVVKLSGDERFLHDMDMFRYLENFEPATSGLWEIPTLQCNDCKREAFNSEGNPIKYYKYIKTNNLEESYSESLICSEILEYYFKDNSNKFDLSGTSNSGKSMMIDYYSNNNSTIIITSKNNTYKEHISHNHKVVTLPYIKELFLSAFI